MDSQQQRPRTRRRRKKRRILWDRVFLLAAITLAVIMGLIFLFTRKSDDQETGEPEQTEPTEGVLAEGWEKIRLMQSDMASGTLILVNADYGFDPESAPKTECLYDVKSESYFIGSRDLMVAECIVQPLNQWLDEFCRITDVDNVNVVAGYRTEEYQQGLRDNAIENHDLEYANQYIALPGHSEHHTGYAIDLDSYYEETGLSGGFDGSGVYQWLVDNAWQYGFVQRYPLGKEDITGIAYEQWHFRYVGLPHSQIMDEKDLCLEEYIDYLRAYPYDGQHLMAESEGTSYEIYYCSGLEVVVPTDRSYEISGNNVDGFIVTVKN